MDHDCVEIYWVWISTCSTEAEKYVDAFKEGIPISICHITKEMYRFVEEWELEDLNLPEDHGNEGHCTEEEAKNRLFGNTFNAFVPFNFPTTARTHLAVRSERITRYIGNEFWNMYEFYIAVFSTNHHQVDMISGSQIGSINHLKLSSITLEAFQYMLNKIWSTMYKSLLITEVYSKMFTFFLPEQWVNVPQVKKSA